MRDIEVVLGSGPDHGPIAVIRGGDVLPVDDAGDELTGDGYGELGYERIIELDWKSAVRAFTNGEMDECDLSRLREFLASELIRLGVRDIHGKLPRPASSVEQTAYAELGGGVGAR